MYRRQAQMPDIDPQSYGGMFYDPYSPGLNVGMGLRNLAEYHFKMKEAMRQQKLAEEMERRKMELYERQENRLGQPPPQVEKPHPVAALAAQLRAADPELSEGDSIKEATNRLHPMQREATPPRPYESEVKLRLAGFESGSPEAKTALFPHLAKEPKPTDKEPGLTPSNAANIRNANERLHTQVFKDYNPNDRIKQAKKASKRFGGDPSIPLPSPVYGTDMRFPPSYYLAKRHETQGVAREEETDYIKRLEAMLQYFIDKARVEYPRFRDWAVSEERTLPGMDANFIKDLYEIYAKL